VLVLVQVQVTPINAFLVGVTVTPASGAAPVKISHQSGAGKIISNIGLGGIQVGGNLPKIQDFTCYPCFESGRKQNQMPDP
jgi:hypothetical protein